MIFLLTQKETVYESDGSTYFRAKMNWLTKPFSYILKHAGSVSHFIDCNELIKLLAPAKDFLELKIMWGIVVIMFILLIGFILALVLASGIMWGMILMGFCIASIPVIIILKCCFNSRLAEHYRKMNEEHLNKKGLNIDMDQCCGCGYVDYLNVTRIGLKLDDTAR